MTPEGVFFGTEERCFSRRSGTGRRWSVLLGADRTGGSFFALSAEKNVRQRKFYIITYIRYQISYSSSGGAVLLSHAKRLFDNDIEEPFAEFDGATPCFRSVGHVLSSGLMTAGQEEVRRPSLRKLFSQTSGKVRDSAGGENGVCRVGVTPWCAQESFRTDSDIPRG